MNRHIPFIDELWGDSKVDLETGVASIVPESRSESPPEFTRTDTHNEQKPPIAQNGVIVAILME